MNTKIIILSPNKDTLFTKEQISQLKSFGDTIFITEIKPFEEIPELFEAGEKILAIDPDFCDWNVPNDVLDKIPDLQAVCLQTTSFSWIDVDYLARKNIPVMNLRGFSSYAVAEWAAMMALNLARKIPLVIKDGWKYDYVNHQGIEMKGKTAGIIGLGNIGTRIAEICKGMDMKVIYWSRNSKDERFEYKELADLMKNVDFIFPTTAQNDETKGLITDAMLNSMKKEAIFVSIVHHVYNHELLLEKAKNHEIYGYGFEEDKVSAFGKYEGNVWDGPQLAWTTKGSMKRNSEQWILSIEKATKKDYETRVN